MAAKIIGVIAEYTGFKKYWQGPIYQSDKRLDDKTVAVTGANTGIGLITAKELCRRGAKVVIMCRNVEKGANAIKSIKSDLADSDKIGELKLMELDLGSLASVRRCAKEFMEKEKRLDILVLNAGVMVTEVNQRTKEGFELQMGTNHLGHFLLTKTLLPLMKDTAEKTKDGRIVVVSSIAHSFSTNRIRVHDLIWNKENEYSPLQGYAQSKLANILYAQELGKRLQGTGITTYSLHPGVIKTNLNQHAGSSSSGFVRFLSWMLYDLTTEFIKEPIHGAQTTIYCCLEDSIKNETGRYYADYRKTMLRTPWSWNEKDAKKLYEISEELISR